MFRNYKWGHSEAVVKESVRYLNKWLNAYKDYDLKDHILLHEDFPLQFVAGNNYKALTAKINIHKDKSKFIVPTILLLVKNKQNSIQSLKILFSKVCLEGALTNYDPEGYMRGSSKTLFPKGFVPMIFAVPEEKIDSMFRIPKQVEKLLGQVENKGMNSTSYIHQPAHWFLHQLQCQFNQPKYRLDNRLRNIEQYALAFQFEDKLQSILSSEKNWLTAKAEAIQLALDNLSSFISTFIDLKAPTMYHDLLCQIEDSADLILFEKKKSEIEKVGPQSSSYMNL